MKVLRHVISVTVTLVVMTACVFSTSPHQDAAMIKQTYDSNLSALSAYQLGHYGLRMYRQTQDDDYQAAVWTDMARIASRLNGYSASISSKDDVLRLGAARLESYSSGDNERDALRHDAAKGREEYLVLGAGLISSMARANEYGLKHRDDDKLREILSWYDFHDYATNPEMIRAWAAQLANQVYWLKQLGENDLTHQFSLALKATYPDKKDSMLSVQQYNNKLYGMTHIILAASEYYRKSVKEAEFQWIYDYFRQHFTTIAARSKPDVIAEIGITFLLAGLENDPVVIQSQEIIRDAIDREKGMIPSVSGGTDLAKGEHRNVLAIMLLDWQGTSETPMVNKEQNDIQSVPWGLVPKTPH
ncbi:DUF3541 domain-containing protein [Enterovibrio sp. ZSDZ35]|uniref:DUF3541 domain-containing protein n=1 Tax=Enterovibrio qingdaonensis TaxID=2899818 RepID=A0ABT5QJB8_9GAMM|nr:DUF3541 domain-containing protein [Enterovibrio sp. ZSDZ35]MDD1781086.1 DUF3541 domain-containing protein [Enterovibrio sp. ZSDZ35]